MRLLLSIVLTLVAGTMRGQNRLDTISKYFNEAELVCSKNVSLWNQSIYGPILLVDTDSRRFVTNHPADSSSLSSKIGEGKLPKEINMANTALNWNALRWAMLLLPLPADYHQRLNLLAHELFHRIQPELSLTTLNADNTHLDKKEGRIYLRLELEALRHAIRSNEKKTRIRDLTNALYFRKIRYQLFPGSDSTENLLELNEGLAEYTGLILSDRSNPEIVTHLDESITTFLGNKTFVRSFAYQTIPLYGFLLRTMKDPLWNQKVDANTKLTHIFVKEFGITLPENLDAYAAREAIQYGSIDITDEETTRQAANQKRVDDLKKKLILDSHLDLFFEQMQVSFNPTEVISLDEHGTVYPEIRVTDKWGILTVTSDALMSPSWNKITVTHPDKIEGRLAAGAGWTLELNTDRYELVKDANGNFLVSKK
jgi:hypothetical protein